VCKYVTTAYMCGLETMALTKKQQVKVQVCENNWIRRIVGVKRADKRRMDELGMQVGMKESFKKRRVRRRLKWAGLVVEGMGDEKLVELQKVEGKRRRRRSRMRREDCVKRDLERIKDEWRTIAKDRMSWRLLIENAVMEREERKGRQK